MADCFSMPNAAELVKRLRLCADEKSVHCKECKFTDTENNLCMNIMINCAADAIEQLVKERDAAVADLDMAVNGQETYPCRYCKNNREGCYCWNEDEGCANWEWRGVQEDKGNG